MAGHDPADFEDYYDLLGVERTADSAEIMAAYRTLVTRYHPDVADRRADDVPDEETTAHLFTHLGRAREILSSEARRAEYDRLGHERYLLEHLDGTTLKPADVPDASDPVEMHASGSTGSTDRSETPANGGNRRSAPAWYRAASASGPAAQPVTGPPRNGSGRVVEDDPAATITDLVDRDPLETAWNWFRRSWLLRSLVATACLVGALLFGLSPVRGLLAVAVGSASAVVLTGGYARVVLPRAVDPTTPPPSASVGLLAPSSVRRLRRRAFVLLTVAGVLAVAGSVGEPLPPQSLRSAISGGSLGTPWIPPGVLGAPDLVVPLNTALAMAFVLAVVGGTTAAVICVSAGVWLAVHGGHRTAWPLSRELLATGAGVAVYGFVIPDPVGPALPLVGIASGTPNGVTVGLLGTLVLLAMLARYDPVRTSAATA